MNHQGPPVLSLFWKEGSRTSDEGICKFLQGIIYQGQQYDLWPAYTLEEDSSWLGQVNCLNYSSSSALIITIQAIVTQCTSNGTTHWSVGSSLNTTTVQQNRSRFTSHEGEFTITPQLTNFSFTEIINIITNCFKLKVNLYKHCLTQQAK
jgi:hypothetical protein